MVRFILICNINIDWKKFDLIVIYLYFKTVQIGEEPNKCIEKATEQIDQNGVKYILYEENTVEIDENAEVNIYINYNFILKVLPN